MSLRAQRRNLMLSDRMQAPNQRHEIAPQEYSFASAHSAASVAARRLTPKQTLKGGFWRITHAVFLPHTCFPEHCLFVWVHVKARRARLYEIALASGYDILCARNVA